MATATLKFTKINASLQIGDNVFYTTPIVRGSYTTSDSFGSKWLGNVSAITLGVPNQVQVTIQEEVPVANPADNDYFYFTKNKDVNNSGLLGYYSEVQMTNSSTDKAELFSIGTEIFESSK